MKRLLRRRKTLQNRAEYYRKQWVDLGYQAYYMDQMTEPLRWGHMQNACNWAGHHMRCANDELEKVNKQIQNQEVGV